MGAHLPDRPVRRSVASPLYTGGDGA